MLEKSINPDAKILIIGDCPSRADALASRPFASGDGMELNKMLHEAGIIRTDCHITYVMPKPVPGREPSRFFERYTKAYQVPSIALQENIDKLNVIIEELSPNLIIALGELPLWVLTGETGITKWRGSVLASHTGCKLIPTYSPDVIQRKWDWRFIAVQDFRRAATEAESPYLTLPDYNFIIRPSFQEVMSYLGRILWDANGTEVLLAGDIETRRGHIACMGIGCSDTDAICIPFICVENPEGYWSEEEEIAIVWKLRELFTHPKIMEFSKWNLRLSILCRTLGIHTSYLYGHHAGPPHLFCWSTQRTRLSVFNLLQVPPVLEGRGKGVSRVH
jgi:uracil-DNA glycosylase family 4